MKHTPGPWHCDLRRRGTPNLFIQAQKDYIAEICIFTENQNMEEQESNARLIAAAPDLLVTLQNLVEVSNHLIESNYSCNEVACAYLTEAREAISRATINP